MSNWQEMFEPKRPSGVPPAPSIDPPALEADELAIDREVYRPWIVQRVRSRPPLMLDLRRYDPRSGLWMGWQIAYPHLIAVEYLGDRMLSLDFGGRQFVIEGNGLDELARRLQQGTVVAVQEYAPSVWPHRPEGAAICAIRKLGGAEPVPPQ